MSKILTDQGFVDEVGGELYHHGVLGMKWGVRRYQNKDGSYTTAGLKRYRESEKKYDIANKEYKKAKNQYNTGKISKGKLKEAKIDRTYAKKEMSRNYKQLKSDNAADIGKKLAGKGETIYGNRNKNAAAYIGVGLIGSALATQVASQALQRRGKSFVGKKTGMIYTPDMQKRLAAAGISMISSATVYGLMSRNAIHNKYLRAYYNHSRPKTSEYINNAVKRRKSNINQKDYSAYKKVSNR